MADKVKAPKAPKAKIVKAPKKPKVAKPKPPKADSNKAPGGRAETRETPGKGHNIASLREVGVDFVERYLALNKAMADDMAGYKSDFAKLYGDAKTALGLKEAVIKKELKRILANKRAMEAEQEMDASDREQTELWRSAMAGTQFEMFAEGDLAEPEDGTGKDDDAEESHGAEEDAGE